MEIDALSADFRIRLDRLLASAATVTVEDVPVLLWKDPVFHNLLVGEETGQVQISGIFDFQMSAYGSRVFDFFHMEKDLEGRYPAVIYSSWEDIQPFYDGYEETGMRACEMDETHLLLRDIVHAAEGARFWWVCAGILHPTTLNLLDDVLNGLEKLSRKV